MRYLKKKLIIHIYLNTEAQCIFNIVEWLAARRNNSRVREQKKNEGFASAIRIINPMTGVWW